MANFSDDSPITANLGLTSGTGTSSPFGFPTPPPPPYVRHPGDVSQDAVQRSQTMAAMTVQSATGGFAQQYRANMSSLNSQMFNPYVAQSMASMGGFGGFNSSMMPSPIQMTPPAMGVYRPGFGAFGGSIPPTPPMPLIPTPFTPALPSPTFSTPMDFGYNQAHYRGLQQLGAFVAAPGVAARGMTGYAGSLVGGGLGALAGSFLGGARGAALGSTLGTLGGLIGSEALGFGAAAERITDRFNPFRTIFNQAAQLQTGSSSYAFSGSDLELSGRGLNGNASRHLATQLRSYSRSMPSAGESFTNSDVIKMTQMAGDAGLLNMSQSTDQIVSQMKNVAKSMKVFMQLAGEPDMRAAMKSMGQLYSMGLSVPEAVGTMSNARMYARMAGTSVKGVMQAGLAGAEIFQANGLTAGLGLNVGMGSLGMAQQAVASGAYSPQLLAMQGGVQGIAQREMLSQAATLRMPMMGAAVASFGGGGFGMNAGVAGGMASGQYNLHQLTTMGANNLLSAVNKGGVGALGMYQLQAPMLQDQMGRELGPMGLQNMGFQNVLQTMKMLGLKGQGGFATVAASLYGEEKARDMVAQASSPEYAANMQRQIEVQRNDLRGQARASLEGRRPGWMERNLGIKPLGKQAWFQRLGEGFDEFIENVGGAVDFTAENAAEANGQTLQRTSTRLLAGSPAERARLARLSNAAVQRELGAVMRTAQGGRYSSSDPLGYNARGEAWGSNLGLTDGVLSSDYRAMRGGGITSFVDSLFTGRDEKARLVSENDRAGRALSRGLRASGKEMAASTGRLEAAGIDASFRDEFQSLMLNSTGDEGLTDQHVRAAQALGAKRGITVTREMAEELLSQQAGALSARGGDAKAMAFTPRAASSNSANLLAAAGARRTNLLRNITGNADQNDSEAAMAILNKAGNPDASAFAALTLIGEGERFLEGLPKEKRESVRAAGLSIVKEITRAGNERLRPAVEAYARSIKKYSSDTKTSLSAAAGDIASKLDLTKEAVTLHSGYDKLGLSKELMANDVGDMLNKIASDPNQTSSDAVRKLAERYTAAAGDVKKQAAIADEFVGMARSRGSGTTAVSQSGGVVSDAEGGLDKTAADVASTGGLLASLFGGKNPLSYPAERLANAASSLEKAAEHLNNFSP